MAPSPKSKLGMAYEGLTGDSFLYALVTNGDFAILEAIWRLRDASLASRAVGPMVTAGTANLVTPLAGEIVTPTLGEPFSSAFMAKLHEQRPALEARAADALASRLRDDTGLSEAAYQNARPVLERWVMEQSLKAAETFALSVVELNTPCSHDPSVRKAAYLRCAATDRSLKAAGRIVSEALEDTDSWMRGAAFVETTSAVPTVVPSGVADVVARLLEVAPDLATDPMPETFMAIAAQHGVASLDSLLEADLPHTAGSNAIARVVTRVPNASDRVRLVAVILRNHGACWPVINEAAAGWDDAEWKRVLRGLRGHGATYRPALDWLVANAPESLTSDMIALALDQAETSEDGILAAAGQRLSDRLPGDCIDQPGVLAGATAWPKKASEDDREKFARVLTQCEETVQTRIVVSGLNEGKLTSAAAAYLLPAGQAESALRLMEAGELRGELALQISKSDEQELREAVSSIRADGGCFDLLRALAAHLPGVAFADLADGWPTLAADEKDEVITLLCEHGTDEQLDALEVIVNDVHKPNAPRRVQAAQRIAELTPKGGALPESVSELLTSNSKDLREAAVRAIELVRPRDPKLIRQLHDAVAAGGPPGQVASRALDAFVVEFLAELAASSNHTAAAEVLPLVGAAGRPVAFQPLFGYLGEDAEYDDREVHRLAAAAVKETAERAHKVADDVQERLVSLIDGDDREVDPRALEDLQSALARIQLGDAAALALLYDVTGFDPKIDPDRLFGVEKDTIVRHLGLYKRAQDLGEANWGLVITHMDTVAERLVRSAYLTCTNASAAIKSEIQRDPKAPDYGALIGALSSVTELQKIQAECRVLHDLRSANSEVPHPGKQPDGDDFATAQRSFKSVAKTCLGVLKQSVTKP